MAHSDEEETISKNTYSVYWMVHNPQRGGTNKIHDQQTAIAEAHRLAMQHPGEIVYILQAITGFITATLTVINVNLEIPPEMKSSD